MPNNSANQTKSRRLIKKGGNGKNRPLTWKELSFVDQYEIYSGNGVQAYLKSDYADCSYDSARTNACKLLTRSSIQKEIEKRKQKQRKKVDVSLQRILQELSRIAFSDTTEFVNPGDGSVINPSKLPKDVRRAISQIQVITAYAKGGEKLVKHKIIAHDKNKAIDMLMKYQGAYAEDNRQKGIDLEGIVKLVLEMVQQLPETQAKQVWSNIEEKVGLIPEKLG